MRSRKSLLLASAACLTISGGVAARERIETTAEGALVVAAQLVEQKNYGEAEAILRTLAAGNPERFDMRKVDALAAKIAHARGDTQEAVRILSALVEYDPKDWRRRYDLAAVLMNDRLDREAERHLRAVLKSKPPEVVVARARADLREIDRRRVVRVSFQAGAAPSTNINSATRDDSFDAFGFLPVALDDEARQQSGVGVSYALSGALTPTLGDEVQGHLAARGHSMDYNGSAFDQALAGAEIGLRLSAASAISGLAVATYQQQYFGGEAYTKSYGGRLALHRPLSQRFSLGAEVSAEQVSYRDRPDRDGPVFSLGAQLVAVVSQRLRLIGGVSAIREATQADSLANTQYALTTGFDAALPARINLGLRPQITFRRFDAASAFEGERREDVTAEVSANLRIRGFDVQGFLPTITYRYTDNQSTVDLYDYDRHSVDMGVARRF